jgi:hypothetical protein
MKNAVVSCSRLPAMLDSVLIMTKLDVKSSLINKCSIQSTNALKGKFTHN